MASKLVILVFVLFSTTSGWAKSDELKKYCVVTNQWVELSDNTASRQQASRSLKVGNSKGVVSESTSSDPNAPTP